MTAYRRNSSRPSISDHVQYYMDNRLVTVKCKVCCWQSRRKAKSALLTPCPFCTKNFHKEGHLNIVLDAKETPGDKLFFERVLLHSAMTSQFKDYHP